MGTTIGLLCLLAAAERPIPVVVEPADFRLPPIVRATVSPSEFRVVTIAPPQPLVPSETTAAAERWAPDALVATDREAGRTGTIVRRPRLAAGLSLRLVSDHGAFAPELAMAGPAGRALARLADEAGDF